MSAINDELVEGVPRIFMEFMLQVRGHKIEYIGPCKRYVHRCYYGLLDGQPFVFKFAKKKEQLGKLSRMVNKVSRCIQLYAEFEIKFEIYEHVVLCFERLDSDIFEYVNKLYLRNITHAEKIEIIKDLCSQLAGCILQLHKAGFIYGNVAPENFYIKQEENEVWIGDFANIRKADDNVIKQGVGPAQYMAPEVSELRGIYQASDVYGLGIIMKSLAHQFQITDNEPLGNTTFMALANRCTLDDHTLRPTIQEVFNIIPGVN